MNLNLIIAILILKSIITQDEGDALVEYLNDKPQSTMLRDAVAAVAEIIGKPQAPIMPQLGPIGPAQHAEEMAARTAPPKIEQGQPLGPADDMQPGQTEPYVPPVKKPTDKASKK